MLFRLATFLLLGFWVLVFHNGCKEDPTVADQMEPSELPANDTSSNLNTTPYEFNFPDVVREMPVPDDNPTTEEGVKLGRMLFYDPILSGDSTMACATCHQQANAFASKVRFNKGIVGQKGFRNAMALMNLGWASAYNWDGSAKTLEEQALEPVTNPVEMHESWPDAVKKIKRSDFYPKLFKDAFGDKPIKRDLVVKAISQFERTLISFDAKIDRIFQGEASFTPSERRGFNIYVTEDADCFHCHGLPRQNRLLTDDNFHNSGLDSMGPGEFDFEDKGLGSVTGNRNDNGKFKTPTLRNVELTAPYMHDGRFETLKEVVNFYSDSLKPASNVDENIQKHLPRSDDGYYKQGGVDLSEQEKQDLINFLKTFTDKSFIKDERYSNPFN